MGVGVYFFSFSKQHNNECMKKYKNVKIRYYLQKK